MATKRTTAIAVQAKRPSTSVSKKRRYKARRKATVGAPVAWQAQLTRTGLTVSVQAA